VKRLAIVAAFVAIAACSKQRESDCRTLVQTVGPAHASLTEALGKSDTPPESLETEAAGWEATAKALSALDLKDEGVKTLASEYADVLRRAAKARREMGAAATALDPAAQAKAQAASIGLVTDEMQVKAKVDATCR
jgi:hypothetical protein